MKEAHNTGMQLTPLGGRGLNGLEVVDSLFISIKLCGHGSAQLMPAVHGGYAAVNRGADCVTGIINLKKIWTG